MNIRQWAYELTWSWDRHMSRARSQASHMGCWWVGGRGGLDTGLQSHDRRIRSANKKFLKEKKDWFLKPYIKIRNDFFLIGIRILLFSWFRIRIRILREFF
jgi:hypothetical protein